MTDVCSTKGVIIFKVKQILFRTLIIWTIRLYQLFIPVTVQFKTFFVCTYCMCMFNVVKGCDKSIFVVLLQYGEIEEMNVCDNLGDHLVGNVYVKFRYEEDAEKAVKDLDNRWYNGENFHIDQYFFADLHRIQMH